MHRDRRACAGETAAALEGIESAGKGFGDRGDAGGHLVIGMLAPINRLATTIAEIQGPGLRSPMAG